MLCGGVVLAHNMGGHEFLAVCITPQAPYEDIGVFPVINGNVYVPWSMVYTTEAASEMRQVRDRFLRKAGE